MNLRSTLRNSFVLTVLLFGIFLGAFSQQDTPGKGVCLAVKLETIGTTGMLLAKKRYGQVEFEVRPLQWERSSFQVSGGLFYIRDDQFFTLFKQKPSGFYGEDLGVVVSVAYRYLALPVSSQQTAHAGVYFMPQVFFHRQRHVENFSNPLMRDTFSDTTNALNVCGSVGFQYPFMKNLLVDASFGFGYDYNELGYNAWWNKQRISFHPRLSIGYTIPIKKYEMEK